MTALLTMSGCGARNSDDDSGEGLSAAAGNGTQPLTADELARLGSRVQAALVGVIADPASARYANLRTGTAGSVCGEVNAGPQGEMLPFVITSAGAAIVSASPAIRLEDPADPFPDAYMRYCASVEELERMAETVNRLTPADVPRYEPPPPPALDLPADEPAPPSEPQAPRRGDDSFFNSVLRQPSGQLRIRDRRRVPGFR